MQLAITKLHFVDNLSFSGIRLRLSTNTEVNKLFTNFSYYIGIFKHCLEITSLTIFCFHQRTGP
jgi:hypothetical protein